MADSFKTAVTTTRHRLPHRWNLWIHTVPPGVRQKWSDGWRNIASHIRTAEEFWAAMDIVPPPTRLRPNYRPHLYLFRGSKVPDWENPEIASGGQWMMRLRTSTIDEDWEQILESLAASHCPAVYGAALSISETSTGAPDGRVSFWVLHQHAVIGDEILELVRLPKAVVMKFYTHKMVAAKAWGEPLHTVRFDPAYAHLPRHKFQTDALPPVAAFQYAPGARLGMRYPVFPRRTFPRVAPIPGFLPPDPEPNILRICAHWGGTPDAVEYAPAHLIDQYCAKHQLVHPSLSLDAKKHAICIHLNLRYGNPVIPAAAVRQLYIDAGHCLTSADPTPASPNPPPRRRRGILRLRHSADPAEDGTFICRNFDWQHKSVNYIPRGLLHKLCRKYFPGVHFSSREDAENAISDRMRLLPDECPAVNDTPPTPGHPQAAAGPVDADVEPLPWPRTDVEPFASGVCWADDFHSQMDHDRPSCAPGTSHDRSPMASADPCLWSGGWSGALAGDRSVCMSRRQVSPWSYRLARWPDQRTDPH